MNCSRCSVSLTDENKVKDKYQASGFKSVCRECNRTKAIAWRNKNKERVKKSCAKWANENKQYLLDYRKHRRNPDHPFAHRSHSHGRTPEEARAWMKENKREYDKKNADKIKGYIKQNRQRITDNIRRWKRAERIRNPLFKLEEVIRGGFSKWVKRGGISRTMDYTELIGCSFAEFKMWIENHFETGMTWENHGKWHPTIKTWHIDHHYPVKAFDFSVPEEQKKCFHYTNLYPKWATENLSKRATIPSSPRENVYFPKVKSDIKSHSISV